MARAPRPRKVGEPRPKRKVTLPEKYSHDFPVAHGHDYRVRSIPAEVWKGARKRALAEQRSMRFVVIKALELYAAGRLEL